MKSGGVAQAASGDGRAAQRKQIERIIGSDTFRKRDSLKRLLAYLADRTIDGKAESLKEYVVGVEVFHKPEGYDPQQDGSVRQHIGKLRQKLEEYYYSEGRTDSLRVELPKREFRLVFQDVEPSAGSGNRPAKAWFVTACIGLLLPAAYWLGTVRSSAPGADLDPALRLLWLPFLDSPKATTVCLGSPLFLRGGNRLLRIRASNVNTAEGEEAQARIADLRKRLNLDSLTPTFDYTGMGEAYAAFALARFLTAAHRTAALTRSNVLSWNELRNENVIFLGAPRFNPNFTALTANLEFTMASEGRVVSNAHPRAGELAAYGSTNAADGTIVGDHVLISRLPGIDSSGVILLLEGGSVSSNWASSDYITHANTARELVSRLKLPGGAILQYFQVLLRVKYRASVPVQTDFITFRAVRGK